MPFTHEQFFDVFARYNVAIWPMQPVLLLLAVVIVFLLRRGRVADGRVIAGLLSFLWAWMAVVYHFMFFTAINLAAWFFGFAFLAAALWFAWLGPVARRIRFRHNNGLRGWLGWSLIAYALIVYPLLGFLSGHREPAVPTFGVPCPTTIFTLGVLMMAVPPTTRSVFVVPLLWSAVGSAAAFEFGVMQDYGLLLAGVIGFISVVWLPTRERFRATLASRHS